MKKTLLIVLAITLILVGGIWIYLLMFGAPESSEDFFADLGFGSSEVAPAFDPNSTNGGEVEEEIVTTDIDPTFALNLLSLRHVAAGVIVGSTTNNQTVRYVEKGVGHIYEINLATNDEKRLPGGTFSEVHTATWSKNGRYVVLEGGDDVSSRVVLLDYGTSSEAVTETTLPPDASEFGFSENSNTLYYLRKDAQGSIAYKYDIRGAERSVWFSLPFLAVSVDWSDTPLIFNKPGEQFDSYAYRIEGGELNRVGEGGRHLVAVGVGESTILSHADSGQLVGTYISEAGEEVPLAIPAVPEKCAVSTAASTTIYCAYPIAAPADVPIGWYKGELSLEDNIWQVSKENGTASLIANLSKLANQNIDVTNLSLDETASRLLFKDKTTSYLWLYDTTVK